MARDPKRRRRFENCCTWLPSGATPTSWPNGFPGESTPTASSPRAARRWSPTYPVFAQRGDSPGFAGTRCRPQLDGRIRPDWPGPRRRNRIRWRRSWQSSKRPPKMVRREVRRKASRALIIGFVH